MPQPIFLLDACVIYPVAVRDLLLTLAALDAFEPRWSSEILDEMRRNVLADHPDIDTSHFDERMIGSMTTAFPAALVTDYQPLVPEMDNDPGDRHVAAAAIAAGAQAIVTDNVHHFTSDILTSRHISVVRPSAYVASLLHEEPSVVIAALRAMAARKRDPPRSVDDIVGALGRCTGFELIVETLRDAI